MDPFSRAIERAAKARELLPDTKDSLAPTVLATRAADPLMHGFTPATIVNSRVESLLMASDSERGYRDSGYAFDILKARLQKRLLESRVNAFFVTSPTAGDGKTNTALNLAISLAQSSATPVVLVDMDLRKPGLHKYLNIEMPHGVAELVSGEAKIEDVAFNPGLEGLTILPGSDAMLHATDLIGSAEMARFIQRLCSPASERLVIFDMPPVLGCADVIAFSALVKHYVLVVEAGKTRRRDLQDTMRVLEDGHMLGSVLNKGEDARHAYM